MHSRIGFGWARPRDAPAPAHDLHGVLVTFRRPEELATMLHAIAGQTQPLRHLVVVDNAPTVDNREAVATVLPDAEYVAAAENLGPAGGLALGIGRVLTGAADLDWIVMLDDDDPPLDPTVLATLRSFGEEALARDPRTAAVGLSGVRFDRRRGRVVRVPDEELAGAVLVDSIAGNQLPMYTVSAVREVGPFRPDLFFGHEELELGLRMRDAGYSLYGHGPMWLAGRERGGRIGMRFAPSRSLDEATWRRYYGLRNLIWILRDRREVGAAARVTVVTGFAKPVANLVRSPRLAWQNLVLNARACRDGWTRRMGRTVEPLP